MLRASSYNIYVDLPDETDYMLITHGYLGSVDKVSTRAATYIRSLEAKKAHKPLFGSWTPETSVSGEVPIPSDSTLEVLRKRGYLTQLSVEEEEQFFSKVAVKVHQINSNSAPNFIFMPTYNCNLRCAYCFQDHMRTDSNFQHLLKTISPSTVDEIVAAMPQLERLHGWTEDYGVPRRDIGFFGGEPLLAQSRPIVEYIMQKVESVGEVGRYWAVSNATELHHYQDLLGQGKIEQIQVTLDGPPREHDTRRIYADGSGSFERIAANITMALELGVEISVRLNLDKLNVHELPELASEMYARGWDKYDNFNAYTAPIHASNEKTDRKTTFDSWTLTQTVNELREQEPTLKIISHPTDPMKLRAARILNKDKDTLNPIHMMKSSFCGAHNSMYVFDAFGDIYACWERTGDKNVRIGAVKNGEVQFNDAINSMWRSRNVTTNPTCRSCRYALHCGGGCAAYAESQSVGIFKNHCDGFQNRFRASFAEAYVDHIAGLSQLDMANSSPCGQ